MEDTEQQFLSPTDREDLMATLHNLNIPIPTEQDLETEEVVFDDVPTEYTESYGTGVQQFPGQYQSES
ncbi:hypothetical protein [Gloeothece verrucosa]|uniref:Uncharacterized protein n=1 Tax=Gloeothece verrucosa (strain PCC 7822) TaxID=497965 RepID=E0UIC8_GLOV7|nr:hypothetical protein [Gloeothece verrucosa]ADN16896.1 hypothetical protein Cyan7822_5007 [Gloeothece verrucosa PCC 7822]